MIYRNRDITFVTRWSTLYRRYFVLSDKNVPSQFAANSKLARIGEGRGTEGTIAACSRPSLLISFLQEFSRKEKNLRNGRLSRSAASVRKPRGLASIYISSLFSTDAVLIRSRLIN